MLNFYFPCAIHYEEKTEFLNIVKPLVYEYIQKAKALQSQKSEIYPVEMTENFYSDPRLADFATYVGQSAWHMLDEQGYAMDNLLTSFTEMWAQEHFKYSGMDQHIHNNGAQVSGFYFIDCPDGCSNVLFYDPKAAKVQINLPEKNPNDATFASNIINFKPEPGLLLLTNSWFPHSFTRNASDKPMTFVHFNLTVYNNPNLNGNKPQVEII
jgi:uncharacterized protein (TIGR02466 family)